MATAIEDDQYLDCKNIKPCSSAVYSLVNPSSTMFPPPTKGGKAFPEAAMMIIQFENTMVNNITISITIILILLMTNSLMLLSI